MASAAVPIDRPVDVADVARRQRQTIAAFHAVMDSACRDVETVQAMVLALESGFDLTAEQRHQLPEIALRLQDAREVLER